MSTYYENDRRRTSTRDRRRENDYYDDEVYTNTRDNQRSTTTALVRRRDDSPESVEEVRRDFSPGGGGYYRETITRKSGIRPAGRARSYDNDRYDDRSSYASTRRDSYRRDDDRRSRADRRSKYSDSSSSRSRTPPKKRERRKSMPEEALEALGLTGVVAALTGKKNRDRSSSSDRRSRSRGGGSSRKRSKSRNREQLTQALKAAVLAGAGAAFTARNDAGGWQGEKGKRVLTAAITAGGANGLINQYKDPEKHKLRDTLGSAAAGIAADRLVNGPNSRPGSPNRRDGRDGRDGRNRSRSRGRDLLAGGAIAATAKKISDGFRSRSRSRGRDSRSPSYDSYMDGSPPRRRSRSRSVVAGALSKVGLNSAADKVDPAGARDRDRSRSRSRSRSRRPSSRRRSRSRSGYVDDDDVYYNDPRRGSSVYDDPRRQSSMYVPPGNNYDSRGSIYGDNREFRR